jgi:hypothetical protein
VASSVAPNVESAYNEARYELEDCEAEIRNIFEAVTGNRKTSCTKECFDYITIIQDKALNFEFAARSVTIRHRFRLIIFVMILNVVFFILHKYFSRHQ